MEGQSAAHIYEYEIREISAYAEAEDWKAVIGFSPVTTPTVPESGSPSTSEN